MVIFFILCISTRSAGQRNHEFIHKHSCPRWKCYLRRSSLMFTHHHKRVSVSALIPLLIKSEARFEEWATPYDKIHLERIVSFSQGLNMHRIGCPQKQHKTWRVHLERGLNCPNTMSSHYKVSHTLDMVSNWHLRLILLAVKYILVTSLGVNGESKTTTSGSAWDKQWREGSWRGGMTALVPLQSISTPFGQIVLGWSAGVSGCLAVSPLVGHAHKK